MAAKLKKDVWYWPTYQEARQWARNNNWPTERIIAYRLGWAVQAYESGYYAGPDIAPPAIGCGYEPSVAVQ